MPIITATITTPSTRSPSISPTAPLLLLSALLPFPVTAAAAAAATATTESPSSYCPNPIRPLPGAGSWSGTAAHVCVWTPCVQPMVAPAASVCGLHLVVIHVVFASRGPGFVVVVAAAAAFVMVAGLAAPAAVVAVEVARVVGLVEDSEAGIIEDEVEVSKGLTTAAGFVAVVVDDVVEEERAVAVEILVSAEVVVATRFAVVVVASCGAAAALGSEELVAVVVGTWRSSRSAIVTSVPGRETAAASAPEMRMAEVVKARIVLNIKIRLRLCIS